MQELEATGDRFIVSASVVEIYCERIRSACTKVVMQAACRDL